LKRLILDGLANVVLEHATFLTITTADYDIPESDIMLPARRTASDADHQSDAYVRKAVKHVSGDCRCGRDAVFCIRQSDA
jgi:hypothetical protein